MSSTDMYDRTVAAFFKDRAHADKAKADLIGAGIDSASITVVEGQGGRSTVGTATSAGETHEGFWASLKDMFMPDEDRHTYAEGLRRGGYLLSVRTSSAQYDRVMTILDADGAEDMNEAESQWRSEGWKGYEGSTAGSTAAVVGTSAASTAAYGGTSSSANRSGTGSTAAAEPLATEPLAARSAVGEDGGKIDIVEEQLRVGKRDVNHGRVRLRSFVVETPVHESVNLRSENVTVTRRPVDRALGAGEALFADRTLEAEEHEEMAVVSKDARVIEEVSLAKSVQDRTQEINDTVRRTDVEVDDGRKTAGASTTTGTQRFAAADAGRLIVEHMDVIGSDGTKVGTVDHLDAGDRIKLTKTASPDGQHHFIPLSWVDRVDQYVHLNKPVRDVQAGWN